MERVHIVKNAKWHPAVWRSRLRLRWPFIVWLLAIVAAVYLSAHGGSYGGMAGVVDVKRELVAPLETARILSVEVTVGQQVKAGDVLVRMDTTILNSEMALDKLQAERRFGQAVADARSDLREAKIEQAKYMGEAGVLEAELLRLDGLLKRRLIEAQDVTRIRARYEALAQAVELYPEVISELQEDLALAVQRMETMEAWLSSDVMVPDTNDVSILEWDLETGRRRIGLLHLRRESYILRAQADGMVAQVFHEAGEVGQAGTPILSLIHADTEQVIGYLAESSSHEVTVGMSLFVKANRKNSVPIQGRVISMLPEILGLPNRLNPLPGRTFRGRHVIISLEEENDFLAGEAVTISLEKPLFERWLQAIHAWITSDAEKEG